MKNTSRRSFTKAIAVGLATAPFASALASPQPSPSSKEGKGQGSQRRGGDVRRNQHDTPPPLTLNDGSFEIEATHPLGEGGTGPWVYTSDFDGMTTIAHIRVIHGSGEMVYQNLKAQGSTITLDLRKKGSGSNLNTLTITGGSVVSIKSNKQLDEPPKKIKGHRQHKRAHPGAATDEFRIHRIRIENSENSFDVTVPPPPSSVYFSEEYRILVWLE